MFSTWAVFLFLYKIIINIKRMIILMTFFRQLILLFAQRWVSFIDICPPPPPPPLPPPPPSSEGDSLGLTIEKGQHPRLLYKRGIYKNFQYQNNNSNGRLGGGDPTVQCIIVRLGAGAGIAGVRRSKFSM